MVIFKFIICAILIYLAGSRLSKYGDIIAEKSGLGHAWIGLVLLAAVTSLPELFNGISAVAFVGIPDLAVGNIVGACLINMAVIGVLALYQQYKKQENIFLTLGRANKVILSFGMILTAIFILGAIWARTIFDITFFGVGIYSILIFVIYFIAQRIIFISEKNREREGEELQHEKVSGNTIYLKFSFFAAVVIACGIWLPYIGEEIASTFSMGESFVGVLFLGIATTLPEMVVSVTALKYSPAMSIGNLLGSNLFNLSLLFIDDIFYQSGSLFKVIAFNHLLIGLFLFASFLILFVGLRSKINNKLISIGLIASYIIGIGVIYLIQ